MNKKLVIITGASSGIGAAVARVFSKQGHPLLLLGRRMDKLQSLGLPNAMLRTVDVTDRNALFAAVAEAQALYGPADLMVNNAGQMLLGKITKQDVSEWDRMINVNVLGVLNGIKAVLPDMVARQHGTIINISSVAGKKTIPTQTVYCGTKFAVHAISENLREEVAPHNVRVITIAPGAAESELLSHTTDQEIKGNYESWQRGIGGPISAEQVADAVRYAYEQPQSLCIREIVLTATRQEP